MNLEQESRKLFQDATEKPQAPRLNKGRPLPPTSQRPQSQIAGEAEVLNNSIKIKVENFNFYYDAVQALKNVSMEVKENAVVGIIGPSGCGKSTYLRCFNRMNDIIYGIRYEGKITINGKNIFDKSLDVVDLRRNVGMVFQKSNPFPKSIFENVAYGLRINGIKDRLTDPLRLPYNFIKGPIIGWDAPKAFVSDMGFLTMPQLVLSAAIGGSGKTDVLCSHGECPEGPGGSLEVPDPARRQAVHRLLNG